MVATRAGRDEDRNAELIVLGNRKIAEKPLAASPTRR